MDAEISIVVPLHNEGANVLPLARGIFSALRDEEAAVELIFVDDASTDDTWEQMLKARAVDSRVRTLRHLKNAGQSAALWTGFKVSRGNVIATLDGDLQNDPADLPRLLTELAGCDMICGVRTKRMDNLVRRVSTRTARLARKIVLGIDFRDSSCALRVFRRSVLSLLPPFNGIHRFMPILARNGGALVREMPVTHHPRVAGRSKYGVWNRLGRGIIDLLMVRWFLKRQLRNIPTIEEPAQTGAALASPMSLQPGATPTDAVQSSTSNHRSAASVSNQHLP
jgi:dolichol-phosphate mannosyltransferase